jgi:hypothetical protein
MLWWTPILWKLVCVSARYMVRDGVATTWNAWTLFEEVDELLHVWLYHWHMLAVSEHSFDYFCQILISLYFIFATLMCEKVRISFVIICRFWIISEIELPSIIFSHFYSLFCEILVLLLVCIISARHLSFNTIRKLF